MWRAWQGDDIDQLIFVHHLGHGDHHQSEQWNGRQQDIEANAAGQQHPPVMQELAQDPPHEQSQSGQQGEHGVLIPAWCGHGPKSSLRDKA